ncbi:MAG: hypothetical protein A2046_15935 [Bacteroidetes bacterium GWA2_30_7]|nr:MAG: hypothetical protein A2046_15935 [Bacteroidetes bacterium GWA2_30_7]
MSKICVICGKRNHKYQCKSASNKNINMKILLICIFTLFAELTFSQTLEDFYENQTISFFYRSSHLNHTTSNGSANYSYNFPSVYFDYKHSQADAGGLYYYWNPVVYSDLVSLLIVGVNKPKGILINNTGFTSGWFGWHYIGGNFIGSDKFVLAGGVNFSDFVLASTSDSAGTVIHSPTEGYHFSIGPFLNADRLINKWFAVGCSVNYNLSFANYVNNAWQKGIKKPHIFIISPTLFTKFGLYFKTDFTFLNARADNVKINRQDYHLGWRFSF